MILDDLKEGDWLIANKILFDLDAIPCGVPFRVMGVSLPWLAVVRADSPGHVLGMSVENYHLMEASEEYVNAWMMIHGPAWQKFVEKVKKNGQSTGKKENGSAKVSTDNDRGDSSVPAAT